MNALQSSQRINMPHYHSTGGIPSWQTFPQPQYAVNGRMAAYSPSRRDRTSVDLSFLKQKTEERKAAAATSSTITAWVKEVSMEMKGKEDRRPSLSNPPSLPSLSSQHVRTRRSAPQGGVPVPARKRLASQTHTRNRSNIINVPLTPWWKFPAGSDAHKGLYDIAEDASDADERDLESWKVPEPETKLSLPPPLLEVKAPRPRYAQTFLAVDVATPPLSPSLSASSASSYSASSSPSPSDFSSPISSPCSSRTSSPTSSPRRHRRRLSDLDDIPEMEE